MALLAERRNYCETDVINTYLVYLSFEFMRGNLSESELKKEFDLVKASLVSESQEHLNEFLSSWAKN